jgi:predicted nucleic acid-binding protein
MKTLFDSSVLVAALSANHTHYPISWPWLVRAHSAEFPWFIAAHSLAECYATLTAKAKTLSIPPKAAEQMIRQNLTSRGATILELSTADYEAAIHSVASQGLSSGIVYDAILIRAAQNAGIERLLTLNIKHFNQAWPDHGGVISRPE